MWHRAVSCAGITHLRPPGVADRLGDQDCVGIRELEMRSPRAVNAFRGRLAFLGLADSPELKLSFVEIVHATLPLRGGSFPATLRHRLPLDCDDNCVVSQKRPRSESIRQPKTHFAIASPSQKMYLEAGHLELLAASWSSTLVASCLQIVVRS